MKIYAVFTSRINSKPYTICAPVFKWSEENIGLIPVFNSPYLVDVQSYLAKQKYGKFTHYVQVEHIEDGWQVYPNLDENFI